MSWALSKYPSITMYLILGLIVGSVYQIFPGIEMSWHGAAALITFIVGIVISLNFGVEKGGEDK